MHPLLTFLKVIYILQTDKWINKNHICKTADFVGDAGIFCKDYEPLVVYLMMVTLGDELFSSM